MRRLLPLAAFAAAVAGCVSVQGLPDPKGALKPGQRLVVAVYPSPGPWILGSADSKAEAAAKLSPLGFFVQTVENEHTDSVSKNLQQYLPRPRLGLAVQESLLKALTTVRSSATVQTAFQAGIVAAQLADWNKSKDQLDWRQRYYVPDPEQPAPRDYAKILTLDDALILDVNVSFGTDANDDNKLFPVMSAASRVYRGDTMHLLWEHEDIVSDQTSSATMTDIQVQPSLLTDSLSKLAPLLGDTVAGSFLKAFALAPSTSAPRGGSMTSSGGGLVPMSFFQNASTAAPAGVAPSTAASSGVSPSTTTIFAPSPPAVSSTTAAGIAVSSAAASPAAAPPPAAPPSLPGLPPAAAVAAPPSISPPAVPLSTPAVSVSTSP